MEKDPDSGLTLREKIKALLAESDDALPPKRIAEITEGSYGYVRQLLPQMVTTGELAQDREGNYTTPDRVLGAGDDPIYGFYAGAGDGGYVVSEEPVGYVTGPEALSRPGRPVVWIPVRGDSMGSLYRKGMVVPVFRFTVPQQEIREDDVYLFRLEGTVQIKRLQRLTGQRIRIISDNERYDPQEVEIGEGTDFAILGRVLV